MVYGPNKLKYVLQEKDDVIDGKTLYVPVTVLLPHMDFKWLTFIVVFLRF